MDTFDDKSEEGFGGGGKGTEVAEIGDIVAFVRSRLGFDPDAKQELVLRGGEGS